MFESYWSLPQIEHKLTEAYGKGGFKISLQPETKKAQLVLLSELWVEERIDGKTVITSQCFVDNLAATEPRVHPEYSRRPFHVIAMTGQGAAFQATTLNYTGKGDGTVPFQGLEDHARPFYDSIIDNVRISDDVRSMELEAMALGINPPMDIVENQTGAASGLENQRIGPGTKVIHTPEVMVKALEFLTKQLDQFTTPRDLKEERLHVWPSILWGATASANESNILYTSRIDEGENAIVGPALLVATGYERGLETLLHESREKGVVITMAATAAKGRQQGQEHMVQFDARRDIPDTFGLKVTVPPMLPRDPMKTLQAYQLAIQSGAYDEELAMRDILKHQDPVAVKRRRLRDKIENSQSALDIAEIQRAFDEAEALGYQADKESDPVERARMKRAAAHAMEQAKALEAQKLGQGQPFQMQPQPRTPAPAEQPPEDRGYESPPLQRQMAGVPNPGGRPEMPQEVA